MVFAVHETDYHAMIRRLTALALWTYFAWYLGATVASAFDGPAIAGPIAGILTAIVAGIGWLRSVRVKAATPRTLEAHPAR